MSFKTRILIKKKYNRGYLNNKKTFLTQNSNIIYNTNRKQKKNRYN